jgi:orotate phosphoribosyltransferase
VKGRILVVDDVITTGGSLTSAGAALHSSGAASVAAVAIAWNASAAEARAGRPLRLGPGVPS